jgi:hypothetical protein
MLQVSPLLGRESTSRLVVRPITLLRDRMERTDSLERGHMKQHCKMPSSQWGIFENTCGWGRLRLQCSGFSNHRSTAYTTKRRVLVHRHSPAGAAEPNNEASAIKRNS